MILALAGVTFFLTEHRRTTSLRQNQTKAVYLAQAGVMRAIYDFRRGSGVTLRSYNVDNPGGPPPGPTDDAFILQAVGSGTTQADLLLLSMRGNITFPTANLCPSSGPGQVARDEFQGWVLRNVAAVGGTSLVIQSFRVNWDPPGTEGILRLDLNNNTVWPAAGCTAAARDTDIPLTGPVAQRTLDPGIRWRGDRNRVWLTSTVMEAKDWIDLTFTLSDGSRRMARWDRATFANRAADFTIHAVGDVREGAFPFGVWRRLRADYRICNSVTVGTQCDEEDEERAIKTGALVSYQEQGTLTP